MVRQVIQASLIIFIFAATLYAGAVSAHGKVSMEDDSCMRRIGENIIHLSAYQPEVDVEAHYCTDIPQAGETLLIIDLVDPSLREIPIGMKVYRGNNETDGEIITNLSPAYYPDGVIGTQSNLNEKGVYTIEVVAEGVPPLNYRYQLRVEMIDYANVFRAAIGPVVGILLLSLITYKVMKSRRRKKKAKEEAAEAEEKEAQAAAAKLEAAKKAAAKEAAEKAEAKKRETAETEAAEKETTKQPDSDAK